MNTIPSEGGVLEGRGVGGKARRQMLCIYFQDKLEEARRVQDLPHTCCDTGLQFPNP